MNKIKPLLSAILIFALFSWISVSAQTSGMPAFTTTPGINGTTNWSLSLQTLVFLTLITFIPAALLMMTSFTRIIIVFSILRSALGLQSSPPNQVVLGLALFLTFFVMSPIVDKIYQDAYVPYENQEITFQEGLQRAQVPLKDFMLKQVRKDDLDLFVELSARNAQQTAATVSDLPLTVIVPAYLISELKTAFQIGFMVFLPFLVIDLIVSSVLMSMGMMMLSPVIISLPFKLILFVLADGWNLLVRNLVNSFNY